MTQGQSSTTEYKERCIQAALEINMRVCNKEGAYHSRFPYWHLDLHSGSGWNHEAGCKGTPIAFFDAAYATGKDNFRAHFCDKAKERIRDLHARLDEMDPRIQRQCRTYHADNREVIPIFAREIRSTESKPHFSMGSIICDPNGWFHGDAVPIRGLEAFCREFQRIDLILNLNVRHRQMLDGLEKKGGSFHCLSPMELPELLSRKWWLIRDVEGRNSRFVIMIGRNHPFAEDRAHGFYFLYGPDGKRIVADIDREECVPPLFASAGV